MAVRIDRDTFLQRALERFGHRYSYEEIDYRSYRTPVKIRCLDHPVRLIVITPERHLQTTGGCKYCLRRYRQQAMEAAVTVAAGPGDRQPGATQQPGAAQPWAQAEVSATATGSW
ncbi:hypothetical protein [Synechococcus sp. RedBA-s]|uniref:hypothetical protein n=1 Tax=Synechococcus sp. RedBA-s TaxID=2823741 RepID=UPI0020CEE63E|nr:hypothetical protein [Synechococcus sp. RedBA-s]MCP9801219.1 hypothetical protein [Synechococcus sp. RedBA-s]